MSKRIYVGNLAFSVTESELNDLFRKFGTIESCHLVTDRDTGRSKGFAFVEMSSDEEAEKAIEQLADHQMEGRALNVSEARSKPQSSRWENTSDRNLASDSGNRFGRAGGRGGNY